MRSRLLKRRHNVDQESLSYVLVFIAISGKLFPSQINFYHISILKVLVVQHSQHNHQNLHDKLLQEPLGRTIVFLVTSGVIWKEKS